MEELWDLLVAESRAALDEAEETVANAIKATVPNWSLHSSVKLDRAEGEAAIDSVLTQLEAALGALCSPYDFRTLLSLSRMCVGLPAFRDRERTIHAVKARAETADRCAVTFGRRDHEGAFVERLENAYSFGALAPDILRDVVKVHALAADHFWLLKEKISLNLLRLCSGGRRGRGPTVLFDGSWLLHGRHQWAFAVPSSLEAAAVHDGFNSRFIFDDPLARWGMVTLTANPAEAGAEAGALWMDHKERVTTVRHAGGELFTPVPLSLEGPFQYAFEFQKLFATRVGIPPEHLAAIFKGIGQLGLDAVAANEGQYLRWLLLTGTAPMAQADLLGGSLEAMATKELQRLFPESDEQGIGTSVQRFVRLASSSISVGKDPSREEKADGNSPHLARRRWPPYLIHGEPNHEIWIVDYSMTVGFIQRLVDMLRISEKEHSTDSTDHDADVRTAIFDRQVGKYLGMVRGAKLAFPDLRPNKDLPNITIPFAEPGREQEIDVPLRRGPILVAVQTWARAVDERISAGDYETFRAWWRSVQRKLKKTDERYAEALLTDPEARRYLLRKGIGYVLPILCSPSAEPVASDKTKYWLRPPHSFALTEAGLSVPRILTPHELRDFLEACDDKELIAICKRNGWELRKKPMGTA